jgi:hypothetical protein
MRVNSAMGVMLGSANLRGPHPPELLAHAIVMQSWLPTRWYFFSQDAPKIMRLNATPGSSKNWRDACRLLRSIFLPLSMIKHFQAKA